jgi:isoamylase
MTPPELGAYCDETGTSFAVFSSLAEAVEVCVFDPGGTETRHALELDEGFIWRGRVDGLKAGGRYGYRVQGPYDPVSGARCNPAKLLLDPYARAISGGCAVERRGQRRQRL